ncbi:unnamed protein product, partial [Adineta steineri]
QKNIHVAPFKDTLPITTVDLYEVYLMRYFATTNKSLLYNGNVFIVHVAMEFKNIGGARKELKQITGMVQLSLRYSHLFKTTGFEPPLALLYGPRGAGKRLMARGIANETGANFILIDGMQIMSESDGEAEVILSEAFEEANYVDYP